MLDRSRDWPELFNFEGRVARKPFAVVALEAGVTMPFLVDLAMPCARALGATLPQRDVPAMLQGLPAFLALLGLVVAGIAISALALVFLSFEVRRLHDMNRTGWLVLALLPLYALPWPDIDPLPSIAFVTWSLLLAIVPGTAGPNAYGPAPKAAALV